MVTEPTIVLIDATDLDMVLVSVNGHPIYYDDFTEHHFYNENISATMVAKRLAAAFRTTHREVVLTTAEVSAALTESCAELELAEERAEAWNADDIHRIGLAKLGLKPAEVKEGVDG